jgi:xylulokinase
VSKFLGIDASTQSMTAVVIDLQRGELELEESVNFDSHFSASYRVDHGVVERADGVVHSFPLMWAEALDLLFQTMRDGGVDLGSIAAIAGSGQQHGTVYLNDKAPVALGELDAMRPLAAQIGDIFSRASSPIWMDTSTTEQCHEIQTALGGGEALLELTGNTAFERFSGPQIRRFHQDEPDNYRNTAHICLVSSYMASLLAGRLVPADPGDGSGTNLMDIRSRQWNAAALAATAPNLDRRMAPIIRSDEIVGRISPYFAERYGFSSECRILPFSGDNPCSMIGMGLVEPGKVALSLGTSDTLFACMSSPPTSSRGEGCLFASPDGTNYMALICFMNGSLAREAVRDQYGLDWQGFEEMLRNTDAGNTGAMMLPFFGPEIVPKVEAPMVVRSGLDSGDASRNVRAVIEAQAMSSVIHSRWMGVPISSLYVTGGASQSTEILQIFADAHACPVHRFETTNSAALGAALRAAFSFRRLQGEQADWRSLVEPFTRPVPFSTIQPRADSTSIYGPLIESYRELESKHIRTASA